MKVVGAVEFVVPADEEASRWVRGIASITVLDTRAIVIRMRAAGKRKAPAEVGHRDAGCEQDTSRPIRRWPGLWNTQKPMAAATMFSTRIVVTSGPTAKPASGRIATQIVAPPCPTLA